MSVAAEIVRVLRASDGKLSGRDIHDRGAFHDLQNTLQTLQQHSQPNGFLEREKPGNSSTFVYGMRKGGKVPDDVAVLLGDGHKPKPPISSHITPPAKPNLRSAAKLHEHLFKTLEQLEAGEIDHIQAKARASVADQIIKLANVQLLYEQLRAEKKIPADLTDMPLLESKP